MTPYQLKRSIILAAIQGKITSQNICDGTGVELLINNEKERQHRLTSEKIKSGKPCKPISLDDELFEIPGNWAWERFGNLVINYDNRRKPVTKEERKTTKGLYDYYGATGVIDRVDEYIFDGEFLMIGEDGGNFFVDRDNSFIANGQFWANNHVHVVKPVVCEIRFLKHCLDAYNLPNMRLINGIAVPKLNQVNLNSIMIPVPPLAEQKRIVAKIEELLPYIDRYEKAWNRLEDLNKRFPVDMQKSILQMAIQGKLVEQHPEEGTAEELYQQIQEEKKQLIKAGKIKKGKSLPEITEDEIPFDIPESWKWVRLGNVCWFQGGYAYKSTSYVHDSRNQIIRLGNVKQNQLLLDTKPTYIPDSIAEVTEAYLIKKNDILVTMTGTRRKKDYLFVTRINDADLAERKLYINQRVGCFRVIDHRIESEYLQRVLQSEAIRDIIFERETGTANQGNLGSEDMKMYIYVPLPPLAEQKRIVAKLEEILPLCEKLK